MINYMHHLNPKQRRYLANGLMIWLISCILTTTISSWIADRLDLVYLVYLGIILVALFLYGLWFFNKT